MSKTEEILEPRAILIDNACTVLVLKANTVQLSL